MPGPAPVDPHPFPSGGRSAWLQARGLFAPLWRTAWYAAPWSMARRRARFEQAGVPLPPTSFPVLAGVATDELARAVFTIVRRPPSPEALRDTEAELDAALLLFEERGWLAAPRTYHQDPPTPAATLDPVRVDVARLECLRFASAWRPHPGEPGGERFSAYSPNETVRAYVLRQPGPDRPWVVCVHATEMGRPEVDRRLFRARHLHERFGLNVVMPVLPLHGSRRPPRGRGGEFPTLDVLDNVHGLAQATSDVRSVLAWVRTQRPAEVALLGLSLGGSVAALVAGLDGPLDCVIAGLPIVDFPEVFARNAPDEVRHLPRYETLVARAAVLHQVVSPLAFDPATPVARRFVFAGLADRLVDPVRHAQALCDHWGSPTIHWYAGGHVGHLVDRSINRFVDEALVATGVARPSAPVLD
jgi:hypothetical protein